MMGIVGISKRMGPATVILVFAKLYRCPSTSGNEIFVFFVLQVWNSFNQIMEEKESLKRMGTA